MLLGLFLLGVGLAAWQPVPAGVWHDDGVYVLVGKSLAEGEGLRYSGVPGSPPAVKFPPGYPGLLALLWWVLGSVGAVTLTAEILNLVFLAAAGAMTGYALERTGMLDRWGSLLAGGMAFASPDVLRQGLVPLSEPLFLLLLATALVVWGGRDGPRSPVRSALLALVLAGLVVTRTAGLAVVLGFGAALLVRRRPRTAGLVAGPALGLLLLWFVWGVRRAAEIPLDLQDVLGPYGGWLMDRLLGSPGAFVAGLPAHALQVVQRTSSLLVPGVPWDVAMWLALPLLAAAVVGGVRLHRSLAPLPWVALAYLAMLWVWPFVDRRLVVPLHPLMVAAVLAGGALLLERIRRPGVRGALLVVGAIWIGGYGAVSAGRISGGWPVAPYRLRADQLAAAVEAMERAARPDAVVGAPEFWAALYVHGGWPAVPSARFQPRSEEEESPVWGRPAEQLRLWHDAGVDHVLLEQGGLIHGDALNLLEDTCPGAVQVLARMPPQILVRLEWLPECVGDLRLSD